MIKLTDESADVLGKIEGMKGWRVQPTMLRGHKQVAARSVKSSWFKEKTKKQTKGSKKQNSRTLKDLKKRKLRAAAKKEEPEAALGGNSKL